MAGKSISKKINTAGELARRWRELTEDQDFCTPAGVPNFQLRRQIGQDDFGEDDWDCDSESVLDMLKEKEPGLYVIWDVEGEDVLSRFRIRDGGDRIARPGRGYDPVGVVSRETSKITDAWEKQNQALERQLRAKEKKLDEKDAMLQAAQDRILDLQAQLLDKDGGIENEIPDLIKAGLDVYTGKTVRKAAKNISQRVLTHIQDDGVRAQLAAVIARETDNELEPEEESVEPS